VRVGILGGVFNPPHIGHLVCAQEAHFQLGLDVVVWIPVGEAPHRDIPDDPGPEIRLEMCELAVAADERFRLSRIEIDRPGPSYTADTLEQLAARDSQDELFLILGGDQAMSLPLWHEPERVMGLATLAVAERVGAKRQDIAQRLASLAGSRPPVFFDMPRIDVSSTLVRRRAAAGQPIRYLVPDKVANFIGAQSLYGASAPVALEATQTSD
jgi:nicotinate-nucleotide adenylyltransferase